MSNPAGTIRRRRGVRALTLGVILLVSALGVAGGARADNPVLTGNVGANDAFTISLAGPTGAPVSNLDPGTYSFLAGLVVGGVTAAVAVLFVLSTETCGRASHDILNMEKWYKWPVAHREGHPDLTGGEAAYYAAVEQQLPPCPCGGRLTYAAAPRCPHCGATEERWTPTGEQVWYD